MILLADDIFMIMMFCPPPSDASVSAMSVMIAGRAGVGTKYKSHSPALAGVDTPAQLPHSSVSAPVNQQSLTHVLHHFLHSIQRNQ